MMIRRWIVLIAVLLTAAAPLHGQEMPAPDADFPTLAALATTAIPPRDRIALARALRGVTDIPAPPEKAPAYAIGDRDTFFVSGDAASAPVEAELRVVSEHLALWVDVRGTMPDAILQTLADLFDVRVYPDVRALWGSEASPGVDGDPRVHGVFARGLGASTIAYFASDHTYPTEAVPTSSARELLFFSLDYFEQGYPLSDAVSVMAHEFQHMVRHNVQPNEETWVNEGLSVFTEHLLFGRDLWEGFAFFAQPDTQLTGWAEASNERAANYGAAGLFMTYLHGRIGREGMQAFGAESAPQGWVSLDRVLRARGLESAFGVSPADDLFADWVVANMIADPTDARYGYPSMPGMPIEAQAARLNTLSGTLDSTARQFGTDYYLLRGAAGRTLDLNVTMPGETTLIEPDGNSTPFFYSNRADMSVTTLTRDFDLSGLSSATLEFDLWYHIERDWDYGYVLVSADEGVTWTVLASERSTNRDPHQVAYGVGYSGDGGGWARERVSLDAYAGQAVRVRFALITDDSVNQPGMALDQVAVPELGYAANFDDDDGGWLAEGWLRTDNRLPQRAWVQVFYQRGGETAVQRWLHTGGTARYTHALPPDARDVYIALSPFAPVTSQPAPYQIGWSLN